VARFLKGDIVLMPFPFSGESAYKHRSVLVLASWAYAGGTDYLTCLITTQRADDPYRLELGRTHTEGGSLSQTCYLRPTYLFASGESLMVRKLDRLKADTLDIVIQSVIDVLTK
jgi:mRNA interferase MazF